MPLFRRIRSDYFDIFVVLDILQETHFLITMKHVTSSSRWSRFIVPLQIQYSWYPRTDVYADTPLSWGARQRSAVHSPSTTADCLVHSANVFFTLPSVSIIPWPDFFRCPLRKSRLSFKFIFVTWSHFQRFVYHSYFPFVCQWNTVDILPLKIEPKTWMKWRPRLACTSAGTGSFSRRWRLPTSDGFSPLSAPSSIWSGRTTGRKVGKSGLTSMASLV